MLLLKAAKTQKWPREVGRWAGAQSPDKAGKYQPQDKERKKRFLGSGETHLHMVGGHKPQASRSGTIFHCEFSIGSSSPPVRDEVGIGWFGAWDSGLSSGQQEEGRTNDRT